MICVVIKGPTIEDADQQIALAKKYANLVELRLDHFTSIELTSINQLREKYSIPMIFTLRSKQQGGKYEKSEMQRLDTIRNLASLRPEYFDLESHLPLDFFTEIAKKCKIILSYHDFEQTPIDIESIFSQMQMIPASIYKIALMANSTIDALRLLCWAKECNQPVIAISMGEYGQISRILAPIIGSKISFVCLHEDPSNAPGQLSAEIMVERYRYPSLTSSTQIYGLIGDPVTKSRGDIIHNETFMQRGLDAVYVKIALKSEELLEFFHLVKKLPFRGLSVTMPLKEVVLPYLDSITPSAKEIGAVNTLLFDHGKTFGFNTDGTGALNAIERVILVKQKRIVIIGAGGAAKAIAYESLRRGASVTIISRDSDKAKHVATAFQCHYDNLDNLIQYDILINCTPVSSPIDVSNILPSTVVMDINHWATAENSPFLQEAHARGCKVILGYEMFLEQAKEQFALWYPGGN